jgi:hypothetical protein
MPALVAGIHVFTALRYGKDVDGRNKMLWGWAAARLDILQVDQNQVRDIR